MGVFVVGMHRSGTSAVAAALRDLGLDAGAETALMAADAANPAGYYEVRDIADLDDEILGLLGGRWDAPPILPDGWENDPALTPWVRKAMTTRASRLPGDRWLLKDPRVSLLLPLWRRALLDRCAAVLVVRNPMEVAWSVALRNGIPTMTGLALWAAYNRAAIRGLGGLPVYVCDYDRLVADPVAVLGDLAATLADWGEIEADPEAQERAVAGIRPELRRSTWRRDTAEALERPPEIDRLAGLLAGLVGRHDVFAAPPPPEAPWEQALLAERRFGIEETRRAAAARDALAVERDALTTDRDALAAERNELAAERDRLVAARDALATEQQAAAAAREDELARQIAARDAAETALAAEREHGRLTRAELRRAETRWERLLDRRPVRVARFVRRGLRPRRGGAT
ncbi:MAG: hypothetical protein ACKOOG_03550 [Actinomycetota bacterium]